MYGLNGKFVPEFFQQINQDVLLVTDGIFSVEIGILSAG